MRFIREVRADARVLGWPFLLFAAPMVLISLKENAMPRPEDWGSKPEPTSAWIRTLWCGWCSGDHEHEFLEWVEDGVVEKICLNCSTVTEIADQ